MLQNLVNNAEVSLKLIELPDSMVCSVTVSIYACFPPITLLPAGVAKRSAAVSSEGLL
jgi:hypothetical protein